MSHEPTRLPGTGQSSSPAAPKTDRERRTALIAHLAHAKWERAGKPPGHWEAFWREAEQEVTRQGWDADT